MIVEGRLWRFGDSVDTDRIMPGRHLILPLEEAMRFAFEAVRPGFASEVRPGDVIVAGEQFGCGSSREFAAAALRELRVGVVAAQSFGNALLYRNCINVGLPVVHLRQAVDTVPGADGDSARVDVENAYFITEAGAAQIEPPRPEVLEILMVGGLRPLIGTRRRIRE